MKKLIMAVAVAVVAGMASAASINWDSATFRLIDENGTQISALPSGTSIVLALLGTESDFSDAEVLGTGTINTKTNSQKGKVAGIYNFYYDPDDTSGNKLNNGSVLQALFKDENGKLWAIDGVESTTVSGLKDNTSEFGYIFATANFSAPDTTAVTPPGPGNVPEPTSGLLVLLGIAGLALKRKVA